MSIGKKEILHVARLAELAVSDADVPTLVEQMNRIVEFVQQLDQVPAGEQAPPFVAGPAELTMREDVPGAVPLSHPISEFAPEFRDGLFLVPRLGSMEDA